MGRVATKSKGDFWTHTLYNELREDYVSQTDTAMQQYTFRDKIFSDGQEYANTAAGLQAAIDAAASGVGADILVPRDFDADGTAITLNKSGVTLRGEAHRGANVYRTPELDTITIDATAAGKSDITIEGFTIHELIFDSDNLSGYYKIADCDLKTDATDSAITFMGTAGTFHVYFERCKGHDYVTNGNGFISFESSATGTAQIYFQEFSYAAHASNCRMVVVDGRASFFFDGLSLNSDVQTGFVGFEIKGGSIIPRLSIEDSWLEFDKDADLFTVANAASMQLNIDMDNVFASVGSGDTVDLLTNNVVEGNWGSAYNGLTWLGGEKVGAGTLNLGTSGENANFKVDIAHVRNFFPPYLSQSAQPTLEFNGQKVIWHDTDDDKIYLVARGNDGDKKIELT